MALKFSLFLLSQTILFAAIAADTCRYDGDCLDNQKPCCCYSHDWKTPTCSTSHAACEKSNGDDSSYGCASRGCTQSSKCHPGDTCCFKKGEAKGMCQESCGCSITDACIVSTECSEANSNLCCCYSVLQNYCGIKSDKGCTCVEDRDLPEATEEPDLEVPTLRSFLAPKNFI